MENIHDKGYKRIFSNRKVMLHFLRRYFPQAWTRDLKEENLILVDKEFVQESFQTRESDLIYRIQYDHQTLYFFLILELQSTVDRSMAYRLLNYGVEMMRRDVETALPADGKKDGFLVPAIFTVVLYNGESPWTAARCLEDIQKGPQEVKGDLNLNYHLVDVGRLPEAFLLEGGTLLECIFLMDRSIGKGNLRENAMKAKEILHGLSDGEWRDLTLWVRDVLSKRVKDFNFEEDMGGIWKKGEWETVISGIERVIDYEVKKGREEGREKGIEEGLEKGKKAIARRLMEMGLDPEMIREATDLSADQVNEIRAAYGAASD